MSVIKQKLHMNPYDYHKYLINEYVLKKPGDTRYLREQDKSNWKTDKDVVIENMKFIWNDDDQPVSWEERLAKKYYEKLYREYCICDLSMYKDNKIANRFRIEKEIVSGKGQFICGEKSCQEDAELKTWEVNFVYTEKGDRKNALVKIRLCSSCSEKLNYHSKKREFKRLKRRRETSKKTVVEKVGNGSHIGMETPATSKEVTAQEDPEEETIDELPSQQHPKQAATDEGLWKQAQEKDSRGRDEEFDDYLNDLLL